MKIYFFLLTLLLLTQTLFSYDYDFNDKDKKNVIIFDDDIDDISISWLAGEEKILLDFGIHSPVNTYSPAVKFGTCFILNDKINLAIAGNFYNEANFKNYYRDDISADNYTLQDWKAIKNYLETYIGWKVNDNVYLGFMLGGGVNIGDGINVGYSKYTENGETTIKKNGYGFIKTGIGLKLNAGLFNDKIYHIFMDQFVEFHLNGNGSVGIEQFTFGSPLDSWYNNDKASPSISYSWKPKEDSRFRYFGFKSYGKFGFAIPLLEHIPSFSKFDFDNIEFKIEIENKIAFKYYYLYEYFVTPALMIFNVKNHFDPTGVSILTGIIFRPINAVELYFHYKPLFEVVWTEWSDYDAIEYKSYKFSIIHEIEGSCYFRFPKVVELKIGTKYYIRQEFDYHYKNDGTYLKQSIGGGALLHGIRHVLTPICELKFKIIEKKGSEMVLEFTWKPSVILYNTDKDAYSSSQTSSNMLNTNILNLAVWELGLKIRINPKRTEETLETEEAEEIKKTEDE